MTLKEATSLQRPVLQPFSTDSKIRMGKGNSVRSEGYGNQKALKSGRGFRCLESELLPSAITAVPQQSRSSAI